MLFIPSRREPLFVWSFLIDVEFLFHGPNTARFMWGNNLTEIMHYESLDPYPSGKNFFNPKQLLLRFFRHLWILPLIFHALSCGSKEDQEIDEPLPLFHRLPPSHTGIHFANNLPESSHMNRFIYEYFYNGGGVAIGDVNNDGLEDIYFTSNLEDNKLFLNLGGFRFKDITASAQVSGKKGWATGVVMADVNQDGLLDIYVGRSGRFKDDNRLRNELFINQGVNPIGESVFKEQAKMFGLDDASFTTQATFFDYDQDGDLDLFLANHNIEAPPNDIEVIKRWRGMTNSKAGNQLLENQGGFFTDVTAKARIPAHLMNYTLGVSVGDLNHDGLPDLYVANDYSEPDHVYLNNGDKTFNDVAMQSLRHMPNFSMGSDIADVNNDGRQDIMSLDMVAVDNYGIKTSMSGMDVALFHAHVSSGLHHQYMYNALQLNIGNDASGDPLFSNIGQMTGLSNTDWSWAPLMADFDNDGLTDVFITNGIKRDFRNNDFNIFLQKAIQKVVDKGDNPLNHYSHWTHFSPTRAMANYAFRNEGNFHFSDVSVPWGFNDLSFSNGAAYSDLDNDGDLDLVVNNVDSLAFVYENHSNQLKDRHFLKIRLRGSEGNRTGIGATVTLWQNGEMMVRENYPVRGFQSSVSETLHFGLGASKRVEKLQVTWPDGKQQVLHDIKADQLLPLAHTHAIPPPSEKSAIDSERLFTDMTDRTGIDFKHQENPFDDFKRESLLPHKMSQFGPALTVGDVNGDGLDDVFIGGAQSQPGKLYLQQENGRFVVQKMTVFELDKKHEDVVALFFDADQDGDADLYVASGGNEYPIGDAYYRDRLYENRSGKLFSSPHSLPKIAISTGCVSAADFDNDGDQDLFVGGRQLPGNYPSPVSSYLFENVGRSGDLQFIDVSDTVAPTLKDIGMVTDVLWKDMDGDRQKDLIIVGEWMTIKLLRNNNGTYKDHTQEAGLLNESGWWNSLASADFDGDGDWDFVAGNLGRNYKYQASKASPFEIYASDFDQSGTNDIVLAYHELDQTYPVRGRQCSSNQMPFIKEKFPSYDAFGQASITEIYGIENLDQSIQYKATRFETSYIENLGNGKFKIRPLDHLAQLSSTNSIVVVDVNADGHKDLVISGNLYDSEVETPRNDGSYGLCLLGNGKGHFKAMMPYESGLVVQGEVRNARRITIAGRKALVFAKNNDYVQIQSINIAED